LVLARVEEGAARPAVGTVDLARVADEVVERTVSNVPVRRTGADELVVPADGDALASIVANLVDNAVRYAVTAVTVDVRNGISGSALVSVADDGPGIPAAQRERVFERFTRLDDARSRDAGGAGLGLPIVRELVRTQGGEVTLEDNAPGLRAVVRLPMTP
jgi:signal transduction histidine kinase